MADSIVRSRFLYEVNDRTARSEHFGCLQCESSITDKLALSPGCPNAAMCTYARYARFERLFRRSRVGHAHGIGYPSEIRAGKRVEGFPELEL